MCPSTAEALLGDHPVGVASVVASTVTIASPSCPAILSLAPAEEHA
jgi:hypothetical protein